MKKTSFSTIISTFIFCYMFWILCTWTFTAQELLAGAIVSFLVAFLTSRFFIHENAFYLFDIKRIFNMILFVFIFLKEIWKANMNIAKVAFNPSLPINPGIIKVPVDLKSEYGLFTLANAITLSPGTITMDITEENGKNYFYVHCIDVAESNKKEAIHVIKGTLEKWVRRVFN